MNPNHTLTASRLRSLMRYDKATGSLHWLHPGPNHTRGPVGSPAGVSGRLQIVIDGAHHYAHRLVWLYHHDELPAAQVDHVNGDPLDNRIENLRLATNAENKQNTHRSYRNNGTRRLGVSADARTGRFRARIMVDGQSRNLGTFDTADEASNAYEAAKASLHPFWSAA